MYGPPPTFREAMLPTRLLVGLVAATVEAEGADVEDRPRAPCRTEARGDSNSVRGGSCGGECGMVMAAEHSLLTPVRLKVVVATRARLAVVCGGWGETSCCECITFGGRRERTSNPSKRPASASQIAMHYGEWWRTQGRPGKRAGVFVVRVTQVAWLQ